MSIADATFIGSVKSVAGAVVAIEIRDDLTSSLMMVGGESHRVGQIGAFIRIPLGYSNLYGVVTQVGAAAAPNGDMPSASDSRRWASAALFGESVSGRFERGVSQFPTVGDEAHVVTLSDLEVIYGSTGRAASLVIGHVSSAAGIPGTIDLARLVARHGVIVGSTGAGKSNLVAVLLNAIATQGYSSARILVLDAHGEYASTAENAGYVFRIKPQRNDEKDLFVPHWALPADEFISVTMGRLQQAQEAAIRDAIVKLRRAAAEQLARPPPAEAVTADSPIPYSARRLWFDLDDYERMTIQDRSTGQAAAKTKVGNAQTLTSNQYPPPTSGNSPPFVGPRRGLGRALELMRSRLVDSRFAFLFGSDTPHSPDLNGVVAEDLDSLVASWVGHDRPITVLDLSGLPSETMAAVCGTVLRIVYDSLFWAGSLSVSGRNQPLLVVLEEAHRTLPIGVESPALRATAQIAKEGRKYGVGLLVVTQRPTELEPTVLSQCGTMIALRLSNGADRAAVAAVMPDDLGDLAAMLPALRTGEGLALGEAMPIPTRLRFRLARSKPVGDDADVAAGWRARTRPDPTEYADALFNWRRQAI